MGGLRPPSGLPAFRSAVFPSGRTRHSLHQVHACVFKFLSDQPEVESVDLKKGQIVVTVKKGVALDAYAELLPRLITEGYRVRSFREEEINLETAFMALTK